MPTYLVELLVTLLIILAGAEVFTNALEYLGERLKISEGVTGSVFAAIGTALPETLVPLLAVFAGGSDVRVNEEIGVGAILGAPLMLSTLSTALMGLAVLRSRGGHGLLRPEPRGLRRDLNFFLLAFLLAGVAMFVPFEWKAARAVLALCLVTMYVVYLLLTLRASADLVASGHATEAPEPMHASRLGLPVTGWVILLQLLIGLALLVLGTRGFIHGIEGVSRLLGISTLLLSLLIIPVATELPEKVNSVFWARRGKDTLAFGNITGAMVFQGTLLPALGILLTPWQPSREVLLGVVITLAGAAWIRWAASPQGIRVWATLVGGGLYLTYLALTLG